MHGITMVNVFLKVCLTILVWAEPFALFFNLSLFYLQIQFGSAALLLHLLAILNLQIKP